MLSRNTISGRRRKPQCLAQPGLNKPIWSSRQQRFGPLFKKNALELYLLKNYFVHVLIKSAFVRPPGALSAALVATPNVLQSMWS